MRSFTGFNRFCDTTQQTFFVVMLTVLRVVLGVQIFFAGVTKFGDWSAEGYLLGASGPFAGFFQSLAGNPLVDQLNIWGLTLIGLSLIFGLFVRPASFFGVILMLLYYFAQFEANTAHGLIDDHIIYALVFALFMSGGVGHVVGLDGIAVRQLRKSKRISRLLFG